MVEMGTENLVCPECRGNITLPGNFEGELICPGCEQIVYIRDSITGVTWTTGAKIYRGANGFETDGKSRPSHFGTSIWERALKKSQVLVLECNHRAARAGHRAWTVRMLWVSREVMTELLSAVTVLSQLFLGCGAAGLLISFLVAITKAETGVGFFFVFLFYCIFNPLIWVGLGGVWRAVNEWGSSPLR